MIKKLIFILIIVIISFPCNIKAAITEKQGEDVAEFAKNFIEQGNERRDAKGYPLLTYALSGNNKVAVQIRDSGYNERLYYIKTNSYYSINGKYLELGYKWCMDCGTFVTYTLKNTLGLDLYNEKAGEPWHVQDIYNDAKKGEDSKYFEFVYKAVARRNIDFSKLQKGDIIARVVPGGNHGMIYVGDGMIAHANRDMIKYSKPYLSGFQVNKLSSYYLGGTVLTVIRIKDGVVPEDLKVDSILTWPDTGETVNLLKLNTDADGKVHTYIDTRLVHNGKWFYDNALQNIIELSEEETPEDTTGAIKENFSEGLNCENSEEIFKNLINTSGEKAKENYLNLKDYNLNSIRLKSVLMHIYKNNCEICKYKNEKIS